MYTITNNITTEEVKKLQLFITVYVFLSHYVVHTTYN